MNKKAFTLVEIMIVVAIITLLAAIAIPNLKRAGLQSRCSENPNLEECYSVDTETPSNDSYSRMQVLNITKIDGKDGGTRILIVKDEETNKQYMVVRGFESVAIISLEEDNGL